MDHLILYVSSQSSLFPLLSNAALTIKEQGDINHMQKHYQSIGNYVL